MPLRPRILPILLVLAAALAGIARADVAPGPVLVLSGSSNAFGRYLAEILLAEGLGNVPVADLNDLSPGLLATRQMVIVGQTPLTDAQAGILEDWVGAGGKLIVMRPDKRMAGWLGLSDRSTVMSNGYVTVDTSAAPGAGITGISLQFHGDADLYDLAGATAIAAIGPDGDDVTSAPAVSRRTVGANGGEAAAFTYDLARSVVYTRQGNPAWAWMERDGIGPLRPDDLFYGPSAINPAPSWVDFDRIAIPQADEQQRLLVNLIQDMMDDRAALPRFWYFPRGLNAVLVMTGDDHAHGGTAGRFSQYRSMSPPGCSLPDWECIRSTSYIYPGTPISAAQANQALADGFEIGLHLNTNSTTVTGPTLDSLWTQQSAQLAAQLPMVPAPVTNRNHNVAWSGWTTTAEVERQHGVRLDANYYYWPPQWVQNRPGLFTGSGIPMRFASLDGSVVDVYQLTTQMTDESGQSYPYTVNALLDGALGPNGYVGAFCANMHTDFNPWPQSDAIVTACKDRGVPVISSRQMLDWLDGRNGAGCDFDSWSGDSLRFTLHAGPLARGLTAMLPLVHHGRPFAGVWREGVALSWTVRRVKGIEYAFFDAASGSHLAIWAPTPAPVVSGLGTRTGSDGGTRVQWTTDALSDSRVDYGSAPDALTHSASLATFSTSHELNLGHLTPGGTTWLRVRSADPFGTSVTYPAAAAPPATIPAPGPSCAADRSVADFSLGDPGADAIVSLDGTGAVVLRPAFGAEFAGAGLPAGWTPATLAAGTVTPGSDGVALSGASLAADSACAAGAALELEATFARVPGQRAGLASGATFAGFTTDSAGVGFTARVETDSDTVAVAIGAASEPGMVHRFRIAPQSDRTRFWIDGNEVASIPKGFTERLHACASDTTALAPLVLRWVRATPYATGGTFVSRVLDPGAPASTVSWDEDAASGTWIDLESRSGPTPAPDASWTAFRELEDSGSGCDPGARYVQYRATLGTTDPGFTPQLRSVAFTCDATASVGTEARTIRLRPARPNPCTGSTTLEWEVGALAAAARMSVRVFDVQGRCVRTLVEAPAVPGAHRVTWDLTDRAGRALAPGLYRVRLQSPGIELTSALIVLR